MPAVRRRTRAAQSSAADAKTGSSETEAKLAALVEELDLEVESKCQSLQSDAERMAAYVRSQFKCQLAKLPKKVQTMTVSEFFAQMGGAVSEMEVPELRTLGEKYKAGDDDGDTDLKAEDEGPARVALMVVNNDNGVKTVLRSTRKAAKASAISAPDSEDAPVPRTTRRTTRTQSIVAATPAAKQASSIVAQTPAFNPNLPYTPAVGNHQSIMGGGAPATCLRLPRRGESILSSRGSPVAAMKSDASAQMIMDGDNKIAALAINNKDGEALNIADPSVCSALPKSMKLKAAQNVLAMQAQLEAMLANLR